MRRGGSGFTALYDANVLYPNQLRDLLMELALSDLYRAKWSLAIQNEWIGALRTNRPDIPEEKLARVKELMNAHVRDCLVEGFELLIEGLSLPDPNDRHVLAAAIVGRADVIVTFNEQHFPDAALEPFGVHAQHPDTFVAHLLDLSESTVVEAVKRCRARLRNPALAPGEYLDRLERLGLVQTVTALRDFASMM